MYIIIYQCIQQNAINNGPVSRMAHCQVIKSQKLILNLSMYSCSVPLPIFVLGPDNIECCRFYEGVPAGGVN